MSDATDKLRQQVAYRNHIPEHWQTCLDVCNELEAASVEMQQLQGAGDTMRIALQAIAKHYTPDWKPGDTHQSTQRLSGIARDALLVAEIRSGDTASDGQANPDKEPNKGWDNNEDEKDAPPQY